MDYRHWTWKNGKMNRTPRDYNKKMSEKKKEFTSSLENAAVGQSETNRSVTTERLLQRDQLIGVAVNPFLSKNNYLDDLKNEDEYLRPKTTYIKCNKNNDIKKDY